jgi:ADP-ribose pyrophosphatase YjhB (NUDIX family)
MPQPSKYAVAVDIVVLADEPDPPSVLLIRRRNPPLGWAIPGGFVEPDEDLPDAAHRELREETGAGAETLAARRHRHAIRHAAQVPGRWSLGGRRDD